MQPNDGWIGDWWAGEPGGWEKERRHTNAEWLRLALIAFGVGVGVGLLAGWFCTLRTPRRTWATSLRRA